MRKHNTAVLALLLLLCTALRGQDQNRTSSEALLPLQELRSDPDQLSRIQQAQRYYLHLRFEAVPNAKLLARLADLDIQLVAPIQQNTYWASLPASIDTEQLRDLGIQGVAAPTAQQKMSRALRQQQRPTWSTAGTEEVELAISFFPSTPSPLIDAILNDLQATEIGLRHNRGSLILARLATNKVATLSALPVVRALDYVQEPDQPLNYEIRSAQRINAVQCIVPGSLNLRGHGVTIGIGDGGELGEHKDFAGRVNNEASGTYSSFGAHGDHVAGIIGGSGALHPRHRGMAPESELIIQKTSLITYYTNDYVNNYGMVLTNNSYGTTSNCEINGTYNYSSQSLDQQMLDYPELLHVYAAGNNGWETCGDFPKSYHTVLRYYQAAKNVLTVGNAKDNRTINPNSSRGPVDDGRIKPEICGVGTKVTSTGRDYNYWSATGTSMAAPAVVGTMALMYERYRELNGGANPSGALMKAIACNTAEDLGNVGPDYTFGYGMINARRAIDAIEEDRFLTGSVEHARTEQHTIPVPAGVEQVKVMLYWHDAPAEADATVTLVNDLDLLVQTPDANSYTPWVLNPNAANVEDLATRGVDRLNNIEQVTIDTPTGGNYTIEINGYDVPMGPQNYILTYDFVYSEVVVTFPVGGETFDPGTTERIQWDAEVSNTDYFTVEWSPDNGATWEVVKSGVAPNVRYANWVVPNTITEQARIRVSKFNTSVSDESDFEFSVLGVPDALAAQSVCAGYVQLTWSPETYATAYELMQFVDEEMVTIATLTDTTYTIEGGLSLGEMYWFSVRAIGPSGGRSERSEAISCVPQIVTPCDWENDGLLHGGFTELRGRFNTSSALSGNELISVRIENMGVNALEEVKLYYQVNNQTPVEETYTGNIPVGESATYVFSQGADLSSPQQYTIRAWMEIPGDTHPENDSLSVPMRATQLGYGALSLPHIETFEDLGPASDFTESQIGPSGLLLWDLELGAGSWGFTEADENGGNALTIGNSGSDDNTYLNQATLNLELSALAGTNEEVYFIFSYKSNLGVYTNGTAPALNENTVYIRGSENDPWFQLLALDIDKNWKKSETIDLTRILQTLGQDFSATTQLQFRQQGSVGLVLDNISISTPSRLPVTMDTFSAQRLGEDAVLKWSTRTEEGNDFFLVEMAEGVAGVLEDDFRVIGKVMGQGFSNQLTDYTFVDQIERKRGDRYYRLRQVDFGGNATASEFRVVSFPVLEEELVFYPNPFMYHFNIYYEVDTDQAVTVRLINAKGQTIMEEQHLFQQGRHELAMNLDSGLPGGLYTVQIVYPNQKMSNFRLTKALD
ncbi:MAG: S8 family serine peptidase [Bacteroidota bacterium]